MCKPVRRSAFAPHNLRPFSTRHSADRGSRNRRSPPHDLGGNGERRSTVMKVLKHDELLKLRKLFKSSINWKDDNKDLEKAVLAIIDQSINHSGRIVYLEKDVEARAVWRADQERSATSAFQANEQSSAVEVEALRANELRSGEEKCQAGCRREADARAVAIARRSATARHRATTSVRHRSAGERASKAASTAMASS